MKRFPLKPVLVGALTALIVAAIGIVHAARDGSGTYSLPTGNPVSTGTTISSTWANTTLTDIATALTNSIAKDGQTVASANLPMGGFKHTNVADATSRNQYAAAGQVQDFSMQTLSSVSGTDTIVGSLNPTITSYVTGMLVSFVPANDNTGAATLSINGLGARSIVQPDGDALEAGDLVEGVPALLLASSTNFVLVQSTQPISVGTGAVSATSGCTSGTAGAGFFFNRTGNIVSVQVTQTSGSCISTAEGISWAAGTIPAAYRPSGTVSVTGWIENDSADEIGIFSLTSAGAITISRANGDAFSSTSSGTSGAAPGSISFSYGL